MARPPKSSVRFYISSKDVTDHYPLRGVASYNRKRLSFQWGVESWEIPYLFNVLNPDGSLVPNYKEECHSFGYEVDLVEECSATLIAVRDAVIKIIEWALYHKVWDSMTSADLKTMVNRLEISGGTYESNVNEFFLRGGLFDQLFPGVKEAQGKA